MTEINTIHTSCKNCVFAQYENITQTHCALDYINKFTKNSTEVLEAYDEDKEFFIINGKKCIGYRENKWFDQFPNSSSLQDKIDIYQKHNTINYLAIINLKHLSYDELDSILYQLSCCSIGPQKIILIRYIDTDLRFKLDLIQDTLKKYKFECSWQIQTILDPDEDEHKIINNITTTNTSARFILNIGSFTTDIEKIINRANNIIHVDLGQFMVLSNKTHNCTIYAASVYRFSRVVEGQNILKQTELYQYL